MADCLYYASIFVDGKTRNRFVHRLGDQNLNFKKTDDFGKKLKQKHTKNGNKIHRLYGRRISGNIR